jgi:hypothetical protein
VACAAPRPATATLAGMVSVGRCAEGDAVTHTVWRHGGRRTDNWRQVFSGTRDEARQRYIAEVERMRQGKVEWRDENGEKVSASWAPCLRTRW